MKMEGSSRGRWLWVVGVSVGAAGASVGCASAGPVRPEHVLASGALRDERAVREDIDPGPVPPLADVVPQPILDTWAPPGKEASSELAIEAVEWIIEHDEVQPLFYKYLEGLLQAVRYSDPLPPERRHAIQARTYRTFLEIGVPQIDWLSDAVDATMASRTPDWESGLVERLPVKSEVERRYDRAVAQLWAVTSTHAEIGRYLRHRAYRELNATDLRAARRWAVRSIEWRPSRRFEDALLMARIELAAMDLEGSLQWIKEAERLASDADLEDGKVDRETRRIREAWDRLKTLVEGESPDQVLDAYVRLCHLAPATCRSAHESLDRRFPGDPRVPVGRAVGEWRLFSWDFDRFLAQAEALGTTHPAHASVRMVRDVRHLTRQSTASAWGDPGRIETEIRPCLLRIRESALRIQDIHPAESELTILAVDEGLRLLDGQAEPLGSEGGPTELLERLVTGARQILARHPDHAPTYEVVVALAAMRPPPVVLEPVPDALKGDEDVLRIWRMATLAAGQRGGRWDLEDASWGRLPGTVAEAGEVDDWQLVQLGRQMAGLGPVDWNEWLEVSKPALNHPIWHPDYPRYVHNYVIGLQQAGRIDEARQAWRQVLDSFAASSPMALIEWSRMAPASEWTDYLYRVDERRSPQTGWLQHLRSLYATDSERAAQARTELAEIRAQATSSSDSLRWGPLCNWGTYSLQQSVSYGAEGLDLTIALTVKAWLITPPCRPPDAESR